jgi:hypothetical protein
MSDASQTCFELHLKCMEDIQSFLMDIRGLGLGVRVGVYLQSTESK